MRPSMERVEKRKSWIGAMEGAHVRRAEREVIGKEGREDLAMCIRKFPYSVDYVQGDTSGCGEPPVDFKTKVLFWPGPCKLSRCTSEQNRRLQDQVDNSTQPYLVVLTDIAHYFEND